ncbi:hypothetical protein [Streptomyces thermovulgaris]|uniref:hypothetical protein n=1 Tax=Streptomyces thermovulgaris TaxID=1934 RepID=UPI001B80010E|nr:hypothetical protein [Streptomyces thermovulgaris]
MRIVPQVAGFGTRICGVAVTRRRSASTPSSALHLHAPDPARLGCKGTAHRSRPDPHDTPWDRIEPLIRRRLVERGIAVTVHDHDE